MHGAVELTRQLVAIPSVNPMGMDLRGDLYGEKRMAVFIRQWLSQRGINAQLFGDDPERPNLVATIDAGKPSTIMLEAHMDTVSHEKMLIGPFDPVFKEGRIYGRGACDTKASLAVYLHVIGELVRTGKPLKQNIVLACVRDEEYSFGGAKELVASGVSADFAIVGEPTELNIIYAHKGITRFFMHTSGRSCHSSMPWLGDNAIYKMGRVLQQIEAYAAGIAGTRHPTLGPATINVGIISGGQTVNTVPASCTVEVEHRLLPGMNFQSIKAALSSYLGDIPFTIDAPYLDVMGVENDPDAPHCRALLNACLANGVNAQFQTAHYATDAAIIHQSGIPCLVFGPGSIQQAHTADEYISISDIEKAAEIMMSLLTE